MPINANPNPYQARAGSDRLLTNLAQESFVLPTLVMRLLFPFAEVGALGGLVPTFESILENDDVDDRRGDGGDFNEISDGYGSRPYKLNIKGLKYTIPYYRMNEGANIGVNWGARGTQRLAETAQMKLEKEQAALAGDPTNYETGFTTALDADTQIGSTSSNKVAPGETVRAANATVRDRIGADTNVMIMGSDVFDKWREDTTVIDRTKHTSRDSISMEMLSSLYDIPAAAKVTLPGTAMQGKILLAYVHPSILAAWRSGSNSNDLGSGYRLPFRTTGDINRMMSSFGYTYVYRGEPSISPRRWDEEKERYYYKLNFTRSVENTGVDESSQKIIFGHLLTNAVASS